MAKKREDVMVNALRRSVKAGLFLALGVVSLGNRGQCEMAAEVWADIQAQLDSHQEQLDSQLDLICDLYFALDLTRPPECPLDLPDDPEPCFPGSTDPRCDPPSPGPPRS